MANEINNNELIALEDQAKGAKAVEEAKSGKSSKKASKKVKTNKKSLGQKIKEIFSELKKVSWPSFGKVVKQTGVVIAVVLFFLIVIGVADIVLGLLYKLLVA